METPTKRWGPVPGPLVEDSYRRSKSRPPAHSRLTRSSGNRTAHPKDQQLRKAVGRGSDYDPGAAVPLEPDPQPDSRTEFPETATSKQLSFLNQWAPEYSLPRTCKSPAETRVLAFAIPAPRPGRRKRAAVPGGLDAFKAARRSSRLQCAPLPDRDQHNSTLCAPPARQAEVPGHPPSSPSRAQAARERGGSDPLGVPVTRRTVTKS